VGGGLNPPKTPLYTCLRPCVCVNKYCSSYGLGSGDGYLFTQDSSSRRPKILFDAELQTHTQSPIHSVAGSSELLKPTAAAANGIRLLVGISTRKTRRTLPPQKRLKVDQLQ